MNISLNGTIPLSLLQAKSLGSYFFIEPESYDAEVMKKRWNEKTKNFVGELAKAYQSANDFSAPSVENIFKQTCEKLSIKTGEVMQLFRVCISGVGGGPALFEAASLIGKEKIISRLESATKKL